MNCDGNLSERVDFWSGHGNCRELPVDYYGGLLEIIVVPVAGDNQEMTPLMDDDCLRLFDPAGGTSREIELDMQGE